MAFNHEYPYVDSQMFNDDWLINQVKKLLKEFAEFVNLNTIKYADPILWSVARQYEQNTVVIDPETGDAYISTHPVPYGVSLSNTSYWTKIFNYAAQLTTLRKQIAAADEELSKTATAARTAGDLVWLNGYLYKVTADMIAGDSYVVNSNCIKITIEEELKAIAESFDDVIGELEDLTTDDKQNIVAAINSLVTIIGSLDDLETEDKSSLVAAINELSTGLSTVVDNLGDISELETEDKSSAVAAINEVVSAISDVNKHFYNVKDFGAKGDGITDDTAAIQACFDAIEIENISGHKDIAGAVFPNGHYVVSGQLILPSNCEIIGNYPSIGKDYHELPDETTNGSWLFITDATEADYKPNTNNDNGTICLRTGSIMRGFGIYYPNQTLINGNPVQYRPTFFLGRYANTQLCDIFAVNPYVFYYAIVRHAHAELHNIRMCAIYRGIINYYGPEGDWYDNIEHTLNYFAYCNGVDGAFTQWIDGNLQFMNIIGGDWNRFTECSCYGCLNGYILSVYDDGGTPRGVRHAHFLNCTAEAVFDDAIRIAGDSHVHDNIWFNDGTYQANAGNQLFNCGGLKSIHFNNVTFRAYGHAINCTDADVLQVMGCHFFDYGTRGFQSNARGVVTSAPYNIIVGNVFNGNNDSHARGVAFYGTTDDSSVCENIFMNMYTSNPCIEFNGTSTNRVKVLNNGFPNVSNPVTGSLNKSNIYQSGANGSTITNLIKVTEVTANTNNSGGVAISTEYDGQIIGVVPDGSVRGFVVEGGDYAQFTTLAGVVLDTQSVTFKILYI